MSDVDQIQAAEDVILSSEGGMDAADIRRRALAGTVVVGLRSVGLRVLGLAGNLVIARLLVPRQLGEVAVGITLTSSALFLSDAGLGSALIRRRQTPTDVELGTLVLLQLVVGGLLAAVTWVVGLQFGTIGVLTAIMMSALPIMALRTTSVLMLERQLDYRPIARVDVSDAFAFQVVSIAGVAAGLGPWGIALAVPIRTVVGTIVLFASAPTYLRAPRLDMSTVKSLLGFGLRYQAINVVNVGRDQTTNLLVAAMAGIAALGVWDMALNVLQLPSMILQTLLRVSFPGLSRLLATGEDVQPVLIRTAGIVAVVMSCVLGLLLGTGPFLIPTLFGERWREVVPILPGVCLGWMVGVPMAVAAGGYLLALEDARPVLRATVSHTVGQLVVAAALLPVVGVKAIGVAYLVSSVIDVLLLTRGVRRHSDVSLLRPVAGPFVAGAVVGGAAFAISYGSAASWTGLILVGCATSAGLCAALFAFAREQVRSTIAVLSTALARRSQPPVRPSASRA